LTVAHSGIDLTRDMIFLRDATESKEEIVVTRRIGINKGADLPYRFYLTTSGAVSGPPQLRK
jgi:3-methyladenine DNA glycosylase Mpg